MPAHLHFLPLLLGDQDLTGLGALERADDAALLDLVDDACGARVTKLEPALQHGRGCLPTVHDDVDRFLDHLVLVLARVAGRAAALAVHLLRLALDVLEDLLIIFSRACLLDMRDDRLDLVRRDKAALHAGGLALAERCIQHIALADQLFRAGRIQDDARLDLARYRKRDARRDVRLHDAGDDVRRGALGRYDQMHTRSARFLRNTADRGLDLLGCDHHQVSQLVDHNDDLRQHLILLGVAALLLLCLGLFRAHQVIIADQIAHLMVCEQLVAALHLADRPVERAGRLFRVGNDRDEQVRNAVVVAQLDHLRVDHDQPHFLGRGLIQNRDQHGVDAHGLA